jgi:hypothetical protein
MPFEELTKRTDANGRLILEYDFGSENADREVRVSLDLLAPPHQYRGSRKHILDLVSANNFLERMQTLIGVDYIALDPTPEPMPGGFNSPGELDLEEYVRRSLGQAVAAQLRDHRGRNWWAPNGGTRPQMDLICRAHIAGQPGLLFVEAKAHEGELDWGGKPLADDATDGSVLNHENIGTQIRLASESLDNLCPGFDLSIASHYQLANRLTYLWKLASIGIPVALLYLGFLGDDEYFSCDYLRDEAHWLRVMGGYLEGVVPQSFPEQVMMSADTPIVMLIRSELVHQQHGG